MAFPVLGCGGGTQMGKQAPMIDSAIRWPSKAMLSRVFALSLMGVAPLMCVNPASAQSWPDAAALVIAPVLFMAPSSEAPFPIRIVSGAAMTRQTMVLIRGLPATIALSEGRLFDSGVWGITAADLSALKIAASSLANGGNELAISLMSLEGTLLAEATSRLVIGAGTPAPAASASSCDQTIFTATARQTVPAPPRAGGVPVAKRLTADETDQLLGVVKNGQEQMRLGNVAAARLLYRQAAESGLPAAALALAATFDADELNKLHVLGGVQADAAQARLWYQKARELGSADARERLQRLGAR